MADKTNLVKAPRSKDYYDGVVQGLELAKDKFRKDDTVSYIDLIDWMLSTFKEYATIAGHTPKGPLEIDEIVRKFSVPPQVEAIPVEKIETPSETTHVINTFLNPDKKATLSQIKQGDIDWLLEALNDVGNKFRARALPKFATGTDYVQPKDAPKSPDGYNGPGPRFDSARPGPKMIEGLKGAWSFHIQDNTTLSPIGIQSAIAEMGLKLNEVIGTINTLINSIKPSSHESDNG